MHVDKKNIWITNANFPIYSGNLEMFQKEAMLWKCVINSFFHTESYRSANVRASQVKSWNNWWKTESIRIKRLQYYSCYSTFVENYIYWQHFAMFTTFFDENNDVAAIDLCHTLDLRPHDTVWQSLNNLTLTY